MTTLILGLLAILFLVADDWTTQEALSVSTKAGYRFGESSKFLKLVAKLFEINPFDNRSMKVLVHVYTVMAFCLFITLIVWGREWYPQVAWIVWLIFGVGIWAHGRAVYLNLRKLTAWRKSLNG